MTVRKDILGRVQKLPRGKVFTPADFADFGSPHAVGMALARLMRAGAIRRVGRGLYDVPGEDRVLGKLSASSDAVADAIAARYGIKLQPTGALAANMLGLSEQVPVRVAYLTDGTPRTVRVGRQQIMLRHTTPRGMAAAGRISGLVIHALRWLGRVHVTPELLQSLRARLRPKDKRQLLADAHLAPAWVAKWMRWLASEDA